MQIFVLKEQNTNLIIREIDNSSIKCHKIKLFLRSQIKIDTFLRYRTNNIHEINNNNDNENN